MIYLVETETETVGVLLAKSYIQKQDFPDEIKKTFFEILLPDTKSLIAYPK